MPEVYAFRISSFNNPLPMKTWVFESKEAEEQWERDRIRAIALLQDWGYSVHDAHNRCLADVGWLPEIPGLIRREG